MSKDTIYRQDAIDAISCDITITGRQNAELVAATIGKFTDRIKALPSAQRWIPCSERLPEENGQYLITVKYEHVDDYEDIYSEHGEWVDGKWDMFLFGHCGKVENIIAWMPLPSPYEP